MGGDDRWREPIRVRSAVRTERQQTLGAGFEPASGNGEVTETMAQDRQGVGLVSFGPAKGRRRRRDRHSCGHWRKRCNISKPTQTGPPQGLLAESQDPSVMISCEIR
jgi:hypothetical protein